MAYYYLDDVFDEGDDVLKAASLKAQAGEIPKWLIAAVDYFVVPRTTQETTQPVETQRLLTEDLVFSKSAYVIIDLLSTQYLGGQSPDLQTFMKEIYDKVRGGFNLFDKPAISYESPLEAAVFRPFTDKEWEELEAGPKLD